MRIGRVRFENGEPTQQENGNMGTTVVGTVRGLLFISSEFLFELLRLRFQGMALQALAAVAFSTASEFRFRV